jgi:hypothetical protein
VWNRHEFFLIAFVHEIGEAILFGEPLWEITVLGFPEIDGLGIRVSIVPSVDGLVSLRDDVRPAGLAEVSAFDFIVDDGQKVQGLMHCYIYLQSISPRS